MFIFLFTVLVIAMTLLVMYKKEKNALKRMIARGRCGLPGMPNLTYNCPYDGGDICVKPPPSSDPFDSQMQTLAQIIIEKRKQITDSKGRVISAEEKLKNLHISSISIRRRYQSIMDDLKVELESADAECKQLNKYIGRANKLKQKFFSNEDECEDVALPEPPKRVSKNDWNKMPLCINTPNDKNTSCHPPLQKPPNQAPLSCLCPQGSKNPLSTCIPPRPSNPKPPPCPPTNSPQNIRTDPSKGSCCDPPQPSTKPNAAPCPPPLPSLLPNTMNSIRNRLSQQSRISNENSSFSSSCSCTPNPSSSISLKRSSGSCPCESFSGQSTTPSDQSVCQCPSTPSASFSSVSSQYIKKPPFSSFLGERMSPQPIQRRSIKQTVVTECIEGDEDETGSWLEPNIVTEVTTTSISTSYPPNCCRSAYEEFVKAVAPPKPPTVKLPEIVDECDPCAVIPRKISIWEDTENVTHSCGTQTVSDSDITKLLSSLQTESDCKP